MVVSEPTHSELLGWLRGLQGRPIGVEAVTGRHQPVMSFEGAIAAVEDDLRILLSGDQGVGPNGEVTFPGDCLSAWVLNDSSILHLEFEDAFIHVWDREVVEAERRRQRDVSGGEPRSLG